MSHLRSLPGRIVILLCALALIGLGAGAASAKPVTLTFHEKNETFTFTDVNPCTGEPGTLTITETGVFHVTAAGIDDQGTPDPEDDQLIAPYHLTGTFTGTFEFVPDDPGEPSYTGHFTVWFGENSNKKNGNGTFTFTVHGTGSDGSKLRFHETAHFGVSATGVEVFFDKVRCA